VEPKLSGLLFAEAGAGTPAGVVIGVVDPFGVVPLVVGVAGGTVGVVGVGSLGVVAVVVVGAAGGTVGVVGVGSFVVVAPAGVVSAMALIVAATAARTTRHPAACDRPRFP
jgi:hypothetical protein